MQVLKLQEQLQDSQEAHAQQAQQLQHSLQEQRSQAADSASRAQQAHQAELQAVWRQHAAERDILQEQLQAAKDESHAAQQEGDSLRAEREEWMVVRQEGTPDSEAAGLQQRVHELQAQLLDQEADAAQLR